MIKIDKILFLLAFALSLNANTFSTNLDLSKIKPKKDNYQSYRNFDDNENSQSDEAWKILTNFLMQASKIGSYENEDGEYINFNLASKLVKANILSVSFDEDSYISTPLGNDYGLQIDYKLDYELNFNYKNYEKMAKKLIDDLSNLKDIKKEVLIFKESEFIEILKGEKTIDKNLLNSVKIFVFLKDKDNFKLYSFELELPPISAGFLGFNPQIKHKSLIKIKPNKNSEIFYGFDSFVLVQDSDQIEIEGDFLEANYQNLNNFMILAGSFNKNFGNLTPIINMDTINNEDNINENENIVIFPYFLDKTKNKYKNPNISQDSKTINGSIYGIYNLDTKKAQAKFSKIGGDEAEFYLNLFPYIEAGNGDYPEEDAQNSYEY